ncbi:MAG: folylpolyglutamate synthase/dihydrofolate synthase family protein [Planctomycetaceae bacterium]
MSAPVATYDDAIAFLFGRINYERLHSGSYSTRDFKLERMRELLSLIGDPHERLPAVHIAGTKGKGSTAVMTAEVLSAAGYRTGLFTSPHISAFEERFRVDGASPGREELVALVNRLMPAIETLDAQSATMRPTYFEIATALAWMHFAESRADIAVLEVGLGGRLDATNLCRPEVTAITSISHDHTAVLGETLPEIAAEKAGIIKTGIPVVSGVEDAEARNTIAQFCRDRRAPLLELGRDFRYAPVEPFPYDAAGEWCDALPCGRIAVTTARRTWSAVPVALPGAHQEANAAVAMTMIDSLLDCGWRIDDAAVERGMSRVQCPLRIEVLSRRPTVIVDAAHNTASIAALVKTLDTGFRARRRILVFAASQDKDVRGMLAELLPAFDTVILTQFSTNPRTVEVDELDRLVQSFGVHADQASPQAALAWRMARDAAGPEDLICVTGSFFLAAEVRGLLCPTGAARAREETAEASLLSRQPSRQAVD